MKISKEILNLKPYKAGKPIAETQREYGLDRVYKLASNESPVGVSQKVVEALQLALTDLHRYPDPSCHNLRQKYADRYDLDPDSIAFGNGSNEVIDLLIRLFCEPGQKVLTSQHAFIAYKICAQAARVQLVESAMTADLRFDLDALAKDYERHDDIRLVFIANPNNPTGTYLSTKEVEAFLERSAQWDNTLVVLDEAYNEFARAKDYPDSQVLLKKYPHLLVTRTLSKVYGLAGIRVGLVIGRPKYIELFNRIRNPFNVNELAQAAALAVLEDRDYLAQAQKVNWQGMDWLSAQLDEIGINYCPSQANFILVDCGQEAAPIYEKLLRSGVVVRPMAAYGLQQHLRVSIGTQEELESFINQFKALVGGKS